MTQRNPLLIMLNTETLLESNCDRENYRIVTAPFELSTKSAVMFQLCYGSEILYYLCLNSLSPSYQMFVAISCKVLEQ